ncbi:NAD-dependent epimerase/dehydratase family protein [Patescibacteria group bacterium]|nr:NAD-dependent epimerase/dehydratase family protein [Patescibacteria group bacterium]
MRQKIGFIGQGWIGKSYADDFERRGFEVVRYALEEPYIKNSQAIGECDIVFIAVPAPTTPRGFDDGTLRQVIKMVGQGKIAVIKSTVLPGTTEKLQAANPGIFVLHSPEFLTEATAAHDAGNPHRNIIGLPMDSPEWRHKAQAIMEILPYAPYVLVCSSREAELIKYGGNNWFYFKVIFINLLYDLAAKLGVRWEVVRDAMAADWRIGRTHLDPYHKSGRGAGGHCFIKDFATFHQLYQTMVGDPLGLEVLASLKNKNIDLLLSSQKDLDLLAGVYGEAVLAGPKPAEPKITSLEAPLGKKRARCLVTGGAGFIGSNLVDELIVRGNEVIVIDNLSRGKLENVNPAARFYEADIRNLEQIKPFFENVDYVFHLAALPRVQPSIIDPVGAHGVNLNGTLNVLVAARDAKVRKVIYSASSSAYGDQETMPLHEKLPTNPMSPYAMQKYMGERYCQLFSKLYNLPTVSLRYFNVYGRRQSLEGAYTLVTGIFVRQRLASQPMTITGDGEQRRDFTSVVDVVRANILAANSQKVGQGEVINIGQGNNHSVNELAQMIGGPTVNIPPRIEPRETLADNSLAKELLDWEPMVHLPEWLKEYKKEMGLAEAEEPELSQLF